MSAYRIYGGRIVTPDQVIQNGTIAVENGRIIEISEKPPLQIGPDDLDATGQWVLPGLIDTHSDAIEGEIQPRARTLFSPEPAFRELERKLAGQGITTMYHSLSLSSLNPMKKLVRNGEMSRQIIAAINRLSDDRSLIRNKIHIRLEITNAEMKPFVIEALSNRAVHQLSFNDHTPGRGELRKFSKEELKDFRFSQLPMSEQEKDEAIREQMSRVSMSGEELKQIADLALEQRIPVGSHDDDSYEKLDWAQHYHAVISEFPIELSVAKEARRRGMYVVAGAPNLLMGRSQIGNMSALDAVREDAVDILCSDYYPPSMLQAVFRLCQLGFDMPYAVRLVSLNPARALRLDDELGSIEIGKAADVLLVHESKEYPLLSATLVEGDVVCRMNYR